MKKTKSFLLALLCSIACVSYAQVKEIASIGKAISKETASSWTQRFEQSDPSAIRGHYYGAKMLRELLSTEGIAGVFIYNGLDKDGTIHLVFKAANKNGEVISDGGPYDDGATCPPICPPKNIARAGSKIAANVASQLIENFQENNAGKVFSHLYGKAVFETILAQSGVAGIYFSNGIDEKGMEHLILTGVNNDGMTVGSPYNDGQPCPPTCPDDTKSFSAKKN